MSRIVIGLTGFKGTGKDTAAAALVHFGFHHAKFADPLKRMIGRLLAYRGASADTIARMIDGDLKEVPTDLLNGCSPRHAMQTIGTEWGREEIHLELWVSATRDLVLATARNVVISDVRFPNEAEMIRDLGGEVWRINRVGFGGDGHASETSMQAFEEDRTIVNDASSSLAFRHRVEDLVRHDYGHRLGGDSLPLWT